MLTAKKIRYLSVMGLLAFGTINTSAHAGLISSALDKVKGAVSKVGHVVLDHSGAISKAVTVAGGAISLGSAFLPPGFDVAGVVVGGVTTVAGKIGGKAAEMAKQRIDKNNMAKAGG